MTNIKPTDQITGNRIIAVFDGIKPIVTIKDNTVEKGWRMLEVTVNMHPSLGYVNPVFYHIRPTDDIEVVEEMAIKKMWVRICDKLKYHSDWNLLMGVVGKIEQFGFEVIIMRPIAAWASCEIKATRKNYCLRETHSEKISAVWQSVVQFINWFNSQNLKKGKL
jgi:hypothetical protein